jgi:hypothetical protein
MQIHKKRVRIFLIIGILICLFNEIKAMPEAAPENSLIPNIEYKAGESRDPFQSPQKEKQIKGQLPQKQIQEKPLPALAVKGIVWGGKFPQAIINNRIVKIGDNVDEVQIVDINKSGVTVSFENRQYNLPSTTAVLESLKEKLKGGNHEE